METIKKYIIITGTTATLSLALSTSVMAMDIHETANMNAGNMEIESDESQGSAVAAIGRFRAGRARELSLCLPIAGLIDVVLDYTPQTDEQLAQANEQLRDAAWDGDIPKTITALQEGADINATASDDAFRRDALQTAVMKEHPLLVKLLLENNAHVNKPSGLQKHTALHYAVRSYSNDCTIIKMLLEHSASIDAYDMHSTPLMTTIEYEQAERVKMLVSAGANPNFQDLFSKKSAWEKACDKPKILQAMRAGLEIKLARDLSIMLQTTDVLQQFISEIGLIDIVDDYAALELVHKKSKRKSPNTVGGAAKKVFSQKQ